MRKPGSNKNAPRPDTREGAAGGVFFRGSRDAGNGGADCISASYFAIVNGTTAAVFSQAMVILPPMSVMSAKPIVN